MPALLLALGIPLACVAYGVFEARRYRTRIHHLPVLPAGAEPLKVLQVSDLHLRPGQQRLTAFLESLRGPFDLVLATGDLIGHPEAIGECARLLGGLSGRYGRYFVLGSSDYYAPKFKNYLEYFVGRRTVGTIPNPTKEFRRLLELQGWEDLTNRSIQADLGGLRSQIVGLDDPYLHRDNRRLLVRDESCDLHLVVVHDPAPYLEAASAGFDLVIAGHTHGGQVRFPLVGAVVTNSEIPRDLARWASRHNGTWLFVNPGLGTGRYAPFRFLCPPEASILSLEPRS